MLAQPTWPDLSNRMVNYNILNKILIYPCNEIPCMPIWSKLVFFNDMEECKVTKIRYTSSRKNVNGQ